MQECGNFTEITVIQRINSYGAVQINQINRLVQKASAKNIAIVDQEDSFFTCIGYEDAELVLVNADGIWGEYKLSRDEVDRLLTELDILILQKSYGQGVSR